MLLVPERKRALKPNSCEHGPVQKRGGDQRVCLSVVARTEVVGRKSSCLSKCLKKIEKQKGRKEGKVTR